MGEWALHVHRHRLHETGQRRGWLPADRDQPEPRQRPVRRRGILRRKLRGQPRDVALLDQPYAKDDKQSVSQFLGGATVVAFAQAEIG